MSSRVRCIERRIFSNSSTGYVKTQLFHRLKRPSTPGSSRVTPESAVGLDVGM